MRSLVRAWVDAKLYAALFATERINQNRAGDYRHSGQSHGGWIARPRSKDRLDESDQTGQSNSALIRKARKKTANRIRRELGEMRRYDSPCALNHKLHHESAYQQKRQYRGQRPQRNDQHRADQRRNHRTAAAEAIR